MEKLLKLLKATNSKNEKREILAKYKSDEAVLAALHMTYDPFRKFYVKKITVPTPGTKTFRQLFNVFDRLAEKLSRRELTGNKAKEAIRYFLGACNKDAQDVFIKILKKDLKVGMTESTLNKVFGSSFIETFDVQLAKEYDPKKPRKGVSFYFASRKLDGLRCYYSNGKLRTRNGHEIVGFDHILKELAKLPHPFVDGELFTREVNFESIQGAVMSNKNIDPKRKEKIKFHAFVVGGEWQDTEEMVRQLNELNECGFKYIIPVEYVMVPNTPEATLKVCEKFMREGYEGAMFRHPEIWYEWKRSHSLLKYKLFKEADFTIVGVNEGEKGSDWEGTLGSFEIEGTLGKVKIRCKANIKTDLETRQEWWNDRKNLIGLTTEVKYQNVTDAKSNDGTYALRFPYATKLKLDR